MKHVKKSIYTFLFLFILSGISYSQITLTLPTVSGAPGTTITAPIKVSDLTGLSITDYQFQVNYNPSIIKIYGISTSGTLSSGSSPQIVTDTVNGKFRVAWANATSISGSGILLNIKIKFKNNGTSNITYITNDGFFNSIFGANKTVTPVIGSATTTTVNAKPTLSPTPSGPYNILDGQNLNINLNGADENVSDVLTYSYVSNPTITGATFSSSTGVFYWTPTISQSGSYSVTFSVTDGKDITTFLTTITVTSTNVAPTLTLNPTGPYALNEGSTLSVNLVGSDANPGNVLTYSYTSTPEMTGAVINASSGLFSWTTLTNQAGVYNVNFKVTDGIATTQISTTITVNKVNLAPTLSLSPSASAYLIAEGQTLTITLLGTDSNTGDVLTYSIPTPATLPTGANLTGNVFTWTPTYDQSSTAPYNFTFTVTDQSGLFASVSKIILVNNTNQAPVFTTELPADVIAQVYDPPVPDSYTFQYVAVDPDNDDVVYILVSGPIGSSITADGLFSWSPLVSQAGKSYVVIVQASDLKLSTQSTQQVIKASDEIVGVEDVNSIPTKYYLYQNFPNPFNPSTSIEFAVPKESQIKLSIFNTLGQEIEVLVNQNYSPGIYKVNFNASKLNSGIYLYKIESNDFVSLKKMMLLK